MDLENIIFKYAQLAQLEPETAVSFAGLCGQAQEDIAARQLRAVENPAEAGVLEAAAAALAFYRNCLCVAIRSEDWKAGDLSISTDRKALSQAALSLWKEAEAQAAFLLDDRSGFAFCGVRM